MTIKAKANGQRIGYRRVSTLDQSTARQLDGETLDPVFEDKLSGKDTNRPQLQAMLSHVRAGDTVVVHSLDRLGRNLVDLRSIVDDLTKRGISVQFVRENLTFTGEDSPIANMMLSVLGAVAQFERELIRERQREGIALAKDAGVYKGRKPSLSPVQVVELRQRAAAGESKTVLAEAFKVTRQTIYNALVISVA